MKANIESQISDLFREQNSQARQQMIAQFKYAWVWGSSVRHQPQKVGKEHVLADEDIIQVVKRI